MTICHVVDYFHPEMGYQENHLVRLQVNAGHKVVLICGNVFTPWAKTPTAAFMQNVTRGDERLKAMGIRVVRLPCAFEYRSRLWLIGVVDILNNTKPNLIHVHGFCSLNTFRICASNLRRGSRLLLDDHMLFIASEHPAAGVVHWITRLTLTNYILRHADRIIAVSNETVDFLNRAYGVPLDRIEMIPLGVDTTMFKPDATLRRIKREEMAIGDEDVVLLYTGKLNKKKDPMKAIDAAIPVWKKGRKFHFVFVGMLDDEYKNHVESRVAAARSVGGYVSLLPNVPAEQLPAFFNLADFAVWPCKSSMSALEAMACGCPIILEGSAVNNERAGGGRGFTYDGSIEDLARKIDLIVTNQVDHRAMAKESVSYAQSLSWISSNDRFVEPEIIKSV
jgi:glycosyltransferase involved in cell wall biosynthesis